MPPTAPLEERPNPTARPGAAPAPAFNLRHDRVRWGPVLAGLLAALTTLMFLGLAGLAVGLNATGAAAVQGSVPAATGANAALWALLSGWTAFLLGGFTAGRSAAVFDRRWAALNGALVFLLALPITLWLAGQGLGFATGMLGGAAGALNAGPSQVLDVADRARGAVAGIQPIDVARAAETARNGAWATVLALFVGLAASSLGGFLGTRRRIQRDRAAVDVERLA